MPTMPAMIRIDPQAFYEDGQVRLLLGVTSATLVRDRRSGRLRHRRVGQRTLYQGQWILDWLTQEHQASAKHEKATA